MSEKLRFRVYASTNIVNSRTSCYVEVYKDDWEEMNEREREDFMLEHMLELVEWNYEEIEE